MNEDLTVAVADFLAHKRALGRKYDTEQATLRLLLAFADQRRVGDLGQLTPLLLEEFIASRPRERARSFNHLVGVLGCFLDWAVTQQRLQMSPLRTTRRRRETGQRVPFLFTAGQARQLPRRFRTIRERPAAGRPITPSSPSATGWGCGPGRRAVCGWATSTPTVNC